MHELDARNGTACCGDRRATMPNQDNQFNRATSGAGLVTSAYTAAINISHIASDACQVATRGRDPLRRRRELNDDEPLQAKLIVCHY